MSRAGTACPVPRDAVLVYREPLHIPPSMSVSWWLVIYVGPWPGQIRAVHMDGTWPFEWVRQAAFDSCLPLMVPVAAVLQRSNTSVVQDCDIWPLDREGA